MPKLNHKNKKIEEISKRIVPILKKNSVVKAGIFGSYARGEEKKMSDLDLLIKINNQKFSLLDLVRLERELKKKLGKKVDLITYRSISPYLKDRILKEEIRII